MYWRQPGGPGQLSRYSDSLRAGRSGDRISVESRFSATVQTGPGGPPSFLYNRYRVSFPGFKRPWRGVNHSPLPRAEVKERVELYLYSATEPSWPVPGRSLPLLTTKLTTYRRVKTRRRRQPSGLSARVRRWWWWEERDVVFSNIDGYS